MSCQNNNIQFWNSQIVWKFWEASPPLVVKVERSVDLQGNLDLLKEGGLTSGILGLLIMHYLEQRITGSFSRLRLSPANTWFAVLTTQVCHKGNCETAYRPGPNVDVAERVAFKVQLFENNIDIRY